MAMPKEAPEHGRRDSAEHPMESLLLKGAPGSPYTRKMLALLRFRRIPYRVVVPESPQLAGLPVAKVDLQPTFYLPGQQGELEAVTDSTPLLRRFETEYEGRHARPDDAVLALLDSILEDYADEWLTKALFHYRWHFAADRKRAGNIQPRWRRLTASDEQMAQISAGFIERQVERLRFVGSSPSTAAIIERSYQRFLGLFEDRLRNAPFLFGTRPAAADFAFYGQLSQLALSDPTPSALTLELAPRVYAWVGLMDDLSGCEPLEDGWGTREQLPSALGEILKEAGRIYVPVMLANARAVLKKTSSFSLDIEGACWTQNTFPYQAKCLTWLREEFKALTPADQALTRQLLSEFGCAALMDEQI
ncbi:glutathione S-transferase N-terminal domain-containing protein [Ottowia thiooxydans]|uniref:Glutathione S-transferase n=1 Tax=Ottowia thiooxydans TaxID=219182 RepID=A0ABV2Q5D0_9BURK